MMDPTKIATFGDSYCFDTEVEDDETFQHYLSAKLGVHVSNYGVGNYGLDQALLRFERRFKKDPAEYVIIAYSDISYPRIINMYQHYLRFGNNWAVKPRFELINNELNVLKCPIEEKEELHTLDQHADYLREHDYHYINWYKPHRPFRPWTVRFFKEIENPRIASAALLEFTGRKLSVSEPIQNRLGNFRENAWLLKQKKRGQYHKKIVNSPEFIKLYCRLLREFTMRVYKKNAIPIYLPLRHAQTLTRVQNYNTFDRKLMSGIHKQCPRLHIADVREHLVENVTDATELYTREKFGNPWGHHSPKANELIASEIANIITDIE